MIEDVVQKEGNPYYEKEAFVFKLYFIKDPNDSIIFHVLKDEHCEDDFIDEGKVGKDFFGFYVNFN